MTIRKIPSIIKETWRKLRQNMTKTEILLWEKVRDRRLRWKKILRQYPIYVYTEYSGLDRYIIPDFICKEEKIIIELDWSIHDLKEIYELYREKELLLKNLWYKVLRFKNEEIINNITKVLDEIAASFS